METLQLKDFLNYQFLSGLKYSPDGTKAAFVVSVANEEENCYEGCTGGENLPGAGCEVP